MILTAHQPQYLPGLRLFDKIARADVFVYLDTVPMESSGYENRNKIKTAQGWQWLTVPVLRRGYQDRPISSIKINNDIPWQRKHRKSLEQAYRHAEYFSWTMNGLAGIYEQKFELLTALNAHQMLIFRNPQRSSISNKVHIKGIVKMNALHHLPEVTGLFAVPVISTCYYANLLYFFTPRIINEFIKALRSS